MCEKIFSISFLKTNYDILKQRLKFGFQIHEFGDTSNNCLATGGYYNPKNENQANQGNLFGNLDGNGTTEISFEMNRFLHTYFLQIQLFVYI